MATSTKMKPYAKALGNGHTLFAANGMLSLVDPIGVCVRKFTLDKESNKWIITNSLGRWVGQAQDLSEAEYLATKYCEQNRKET